MTHTKKNLVVPTQGFSLIEMLVAISLLALLSTLLVAAISFTGQMNQANRQASQQEFVTSLDGHRLLNKIFAKSAPFKFTPQGQPAQVVFEGTSNHLRFIVHSPFLGLAPVPHLVDLRLTSPAQAPQKLIASIYPLHARFEDKIQPAPQKHIFIIEGVGAFSYFGQATQSGTARWNHSWQNKAAQPELTKITLNPDYHPSNISEWVFSSKIDVTQATSFDPEQDFLQSSLSNSILTWRTKNGG